MVRKSLTQVLGLRSICASAAESVNLKNADGTIQINKIKSKIRLKKLNYSSYFSIYSSTLDYSVVNDHKSASEILRPQFLCTLVNKLFPSVKSQARMASTPLQDSSKSKPLLLLQEPCTELNQTLQQDPSCFDLLVRKLTSVQTIRASAAECSISENANDVNQNNNYKLTS